MEIWHKRIKELRANSDVTLKEMAQLIGVSEATVQRYESGAINDVPYKAITAYAEKFNCSPSYIMGWTNDPKRTSLFDIDIMGENTLRIEAPRVEAPKEKHDRLERYIDFLRDDDTLRKLVDVAVTCTEDDIEMAIKLLKYFRIKG